jgi:hypothetical protein
MIDLPLLIKLYSEQPRTVDDLPYTPDFDILVNQYNIRTNHQVTCRMVYKKLIQLRKSKKLLCKFRTRKAI